MQSAETSLTVVRARGRRRLPLANVYRQRFNPDLYLMAYGKLAANAGVMTPGTTGETVDGMSQQKIGRIIRRGTPWVPAGAVPICPNAAHLHRETTLDQEAPAGYPTLVR